MNISDILTFLGEVDFYYKKQDFHELQSCIEKNGLEKIFSADIFRVCLITNRFDLIVLLATLAEECSNQPDHYKRLRIICSLLAGFINIEQATTETAVDSDYLELIIAHTVRLSNKKINDKEIFNTISLEKISEALEFFLYANYPGGFLEVLRSCLNNGIILAPLQAIGYLIDFERFLPLAAKQYNPEWEAALKFLAEKTDKTYSEQIVIIHEIFDTWRSLSEKKTTLDKPLKKQSSFISDLETIRNEKRYGLALQKALLRKQGRKRRRVAFLIHATEIFSSLEPIIKEMLSRPPHFEIILIALPRNYSGQRGEYRGENATANFLSEKKYGPVLCMTGKNESELLELIRMAPDFIFRQTPWDHHIPPLFSVEMLDFSCLCYVPYGIATAAIPSHQYNQPLHNRAEYLFCESEFHASEFSIHKNNGAFGIRVTGYPRAELLIENLHASEASGAAWPISDGTNLPKIIWAPHHSIDKGWLNTSTFLDYKDDMLRFAQSGNISILFRPHPALREKLIRHRQMSEFEFDHYLTNFNSCKTSGVDTQAEYAASFAASDFMITDGIGFFSEYLLTGKPLIRTLKQGAQPLNSFGNWVVEAYRVVHDKNQLSEVVNQIAMGNYLDEFKTERQEKINHMRNISLGATKRIVDILESH